MVTPVFQIADRAQALAFYVDWLGFSIDWAENPTSSSYYIQVSRGSILLHLTNYAHESTAGSKAMAEFTGLPAFYRLLSQKSSSFPVPQLQKANWNDKVMLLELRDPAGNCLVLAEVCT